MSKSTCHDTSLPLERCIRCAEDVVAHLVHLQEEEQELFWILGLNTQHRILVSTCVALGTVDRVNVVLRDVFRGLVRKNATVFIAAHNHPSGDPTPSPQDEVMTEKLRQGGELLGIGLLDHVVIGRASHYSFSDENRLLPKHSYGITLHEASPETYGARVRQKLARMDLGELTQLLLTIILYFYGEDGDRADEPLSGADLVDELGQLLAPFHPEPLDHQPGAAP